MKYHALSKEDQDQLANETLRMLEREHFQLEIQLAGLDPDKPPAEGFSGDVQYQLRRRAELADKIKATHGVVKEREEGAAKKAAPTKKAAAKKSAANSEATDNKES